MQTVLRDKQTVLTDNMKTVVVDRIDDQPCFHPKMLAFAARYGFVPRVCHSCRPQTKGKIESTIRYIKSSFWPETQFTTLAVVGLVRAHGDAPGAVLCFSSSISKAASRSA